MVRAVSNKVGTDLVHGSHYQVKRSQVYDTLLVNCAAGTG